MLAKLIIHLLLCVLVACNKFFQVDPKDKKLDAPRIKRDVVYADISVGNTIHALDKLIFYYMKNKKQATVDFAFGIRAVEGELARIIEMAQRGSYPEVFKNMEQYQELLKLHTSVRNSIKQSLPYIEKNNLEYFNKFYLILKEKWQPFQFSPQHTKPDESSFPNISDEMTENESDECMIDMMGSGEQKKCSFAKCWKAMTRMGTALYYNTHQILWLLLGEKMGCGEDMDRKAREDGYKDGIKDIIRRKCTSLVIEMEALAQDGVQPGMVDVFLEQGFVCGSLGFMGAVKPKYLQLAFTWQDPNLGCFPHMISNSEEDYKEFQFWLNYKREDWKSRHLLDDGVMTGRRLLADDVMKDGCSLHTSGVGAAFFAICLRLFYDPLYKKFELDPYLSPHPVAPVSPSYGWNSVLKTSKRKVWSSKLYKSAISIRQEGQPGFKGLRCFGKESGSKASVVIDIH